MSSAKQQFALNERAQHLLKVLVERYIAEGQPVGSRTLARDAGLDLSPATIRNVMSDLEEMGLVCSPHTSAGRMPTAQGYRVFIDSLLTVRQLHAREVQRLQRELDPNNNTELLVQNASRLLSGVSRMAGLVTLPRRERVVLRQVEFLPLSDTRILVILVTNEREVQNRIIQAERQYAESELREVANFLNAHYMGQDIHGVRDQLMRELREARENLNQLMLSAVEMAEKAFDQEGERGEDFVLAGENNLIGSDGLSDVAQLRQLFEAFNRKRDVLGVLDHCLRADGVQIFIGEESGYQAFDGCSLVTAPYSVDGQSLGVLGVIGPTRMAYERVIPIVDVTAKLLGAALNPRN